MAPHDDRDIDAGQRAVVEIGAHEGLGHEPRRRRKAGRVVVDHQVIVDGLGDVDAAQGIGFPGGFLRHDAHRIGTVIAADIEEAADAMRLQRTEDRLAIFDVRLVAGGTQRRGRGLRHAFQIGGGFLGEVDEILIDDAAHAMQRAIDPFDAGEFARFQGQAHQRLIDDGGGAAALGNQHLGKFGHGLGSLMKRREIL